MLKRFGNITIMLLAFVCGSAQTGVDSIYFWNQSKARQGFVLESATQLRAAGIQKTGMGEIGVLSNKGSYKLSQQPYKQLIANLYTEGLATLGRFKLSGSFRFNRVWEDSLGYTLKGNNDDYQPYYYFAGKAGKYERQNLNASATVSYALKPDKLFVATRVNYNYHWTTRSVDPRVDVRFFNLQFAPSVAYKFGRHMVGAGFLWGYGNETTGIEYKNRNFGGNQTYIDRNAYFNLGYGHISKRRGQLYRYMKYYGLTLDYAYINKTYVVRAGLSYNKWTDENSFQAPSYTGREVYSRLYPSSFKMNLLVDKVGHNVNHQFLFDAHILKSKNWSSEFNGSNFSYTNNHLRVEYTILTKARLGLQWELGAGLGLDHIDKQDLVASHYVTNLFLKPGVMAAMYTPLGAGNKIKAGLNIALRMPVGNSISVPQTQENYFTKGVVYPDYLYSDSRALHTGINLQYLTPGSAKKMGFIYFASLGHLYKLSDSNQKFNSIVLHSKHYINLSFGATICF